MNDEWSLKDKRWFEDGEYDALDETWVSYLTREDGTGDDTENDYYYSEEDIELLHQKIINDIFNDVSIPFSYCAVSEGANFEANRTISAIIEIINRRFGVDEDNDESSQ